MNSPHQREQLPDLLSDALSETERARVESHLSSCEQCARELRALQLMQKSVASLPAQSPPESIRRGVRAALRENPKQAWTFASLLPQARAKNSRFFVPTRQLAWGGAVAVAAVGLMLLARPSLQNNPYSSTAPVSEGELATRAETGQAGSGAANSNSPAPTADTELEAPQSPTKSPVPPKLGPSISQQAAPPAPEPRIPAPVAPPTNDSAPENFAPIPNAAPPQTKSAPRPTARPQEPRGDKKTSRPSAPTTTKPKLSTPTPSPSGPTTQPSNQKPKSTENAADNSAPNKVTQPAPKVDAPAPPVAPVTKPDASEAESDDNSHSFAPPSSIGPNATADANNDRARIAPPAPMARAQEAPSIAQNGPASNWTGGAVSARIDRIPARPSVGRLGIVPPANAPILTLGVSKAIGNARLVLLLPNGETQIWRGSMNAEPIRIKLDNPALEKANLRVGQKINARLEQIDGEGNPKGSTLFDLLWP